MKHVVAAFAITYLFVVGLGSVLGGSMPPDEWGRAKEKAAERSVHSGESTPMPKGAPEDSKSPRVGPPRVPGEAEGPYAVRGPGDSRRPMANVRVAGEPDKRVDERDQARWHETSEIAYGCAVLVVCLVLVGLEVFHLKSRSTWHPVWSLKIIGLTLVVCAGLFLIAAGWSQTQIAPMIGLLGTALGYLLGKEAGGSSPQGSEPDGGAEPEP